jgi:hypothetical protein
MGSSGKCLLEEEIEQALLEELTDSDPSNSSSDKSSGTNNLAVGNVTVFEHSYNKDDIVQGSTASSAPNDVNATLTCGYMMNYGGQREQHVGNCGTQNEIHCAEVFKMFFIDEWWN